MVIKEPEIPKEILKEVNPNDKNGRNKPLKLNFKNYDECFLMFHPFLVTKENHKNEFKFETGNWASKKDIIEHCERMSWTEFLKISGVQNYVELDAVLAFAHGARRFGKKSEYLKYRITIEKVRTEIIPPQVDWFPEILENSLMMFLESKGYEEVFIYTDIDEKNGLTKVSNILNDDEELPSHVRIETPDSKVLVAQDFDQRFSYILGPLETVEELINTLNLEGFYCSDITPEWWSYREIPRNDRITWEEDMKIEV